MIGMRECAFSAPLEAYPVDIDRGVNVFIYAFGLRYVKTAAYDVISLLSLTPKVRFAPIDGPDGDPDLAAEAPPRASAPPTGLARGLFCALIETHVTHDERAQRTRRRRRRARPQNWGEIAREFLASPEEARDQPTVAWRLARPLAIVTEQDVRILRTMALQRVYGCLRAVQQNSALLADGVRYGDRTRVMNDLVK